MSAVEEEQDFHVAIPSVSQIEEKPAEAEASEQNAAGSSSVSSWLSSYVSLPSVITGANGAPKTFTAYHIVTIFDKSAGANSTENEVDRRFSDFEKLLDHLRKRPNTPILPDLPKKRFYNTSEQVIEQRRTELEKFLWTILRNHDLREDPAVRYFLT